MPRRARLRSFRAMIIARPTAQFAFSHPAHFIALGFGAGLSPFAPGTAGTLLAFPLWWADRRRLRAAAAARLSRAAVRRRRLGLRLTGRHLGARRPRRDVLGRDRRLPARARDRAAGSWWQAAAFFLFRAFDVVKPPPIRQLEMRFKGGFGVMFDDLLAAGYTLLVLAIVKRVFL